MTCSQHAHVLLTICFNLFMTCSYLNHDLLMTCSCLVHNLFSLWSPLFMKNSWLVHEFLMTWLVNYYFLMISQLVHELFIFFMTHPWPAHNFFTIWSSFIHDPFFMTCSLFHFINFDFFYDLSTTFSWLVHNNFEICLWLVHTLFMAFLLALLRFLIYEILQLEFLY